MSTQYQGQIPAGGEKKVNFPTIKFLKLNPTALRISFLLL